MDWDGQERIYCKLDAGLNHLIRSQCFKTFEMRDFVTSSWQIFSFCYFCWPTWCLQLTIFCWGNFVKFSPSPRHPHSNIKTHQILAKPGSAKFFRKGLDTLPDRILSFIAFCYSIFSWFFNLDAYVSCYYGRNRFTDGRESHGSANGVKITVTRLM